MTAKRVRVGDVIALAQEHVPVEPTEIYRSAGVLNRARGLVENPPFFGSNTKYKTMYRLHTGQVVYSKLKAFEQSIAYVTPDFDGCVVSQEFPTFVAEAEKIDSGYLRHVIASDFFAEAMRSRSTGMGARRERLHPDHFLSLEIPLPSLDEQRAIADRLDSICAVAARCGADDVADQHAATLRERIMSQTLNYPIVSTGTVLTQASDPVQVVPEGQYPDAGILNRGRGLFRKQIRLGSGTKYSKLYRIHSGQLIYSKLFAWEGSVAIVPKQFDEHYVSSEFPHFTVDTAVVDTEYLGSAIRAANFTAQLANAGSGMGQRRQRVNVDRFLTLTIPLPPKPIQQKIANEWSRIDMVDALRRRRHSVAKALPRAARNEVFASL